MGIPVLIIGNPGQGKTASIRKMNPKDCLLIQVTEKPLPFKSSEWHPFKVVKGEAEGSIFQTHNWGRIFKAVMEAHTYKKKVVIIDDFQYILAEEMLEKAQEKGFQKFVDMASHAREIIRAAQRTPPNTRVYITWHTQLGEDGIIRAKTIGKLLDEKFSIEGLFTIVFRAEREDGKYIFHTQSKGDVCKSPMGMFDSETIENDLNAVDDAICNYYNLEK